ncbi:MAG TPA: type II toxin-antitoxin system ParD family antitoxin [Thermomicrobiales bacterium]|jgi:antitoxin ParD1/3/4|nr:type II toxin-antitoxin system ParD family antitoxin [Thermomicrobiales bacterium]
MNVSLTPDLENVIREKVDTGLYASASEVVREALRLMVEHDKRMKITAMRDAAIAEGIAAADRGDKVELTREVWDQIMAEADSMSDGEPLDLLVTGEF